MKSALNHELVEICRMLQSIPTAPFCEEWMCAQLDVLLGQIPDLELSVDRFGNRLAVFPAQLAPGIQDDPIVFVAHLDHPGFVCKSASADGKMIEAEFEGRVFDEYFGPKPVRVFSDAKKPGIAGIIREWTPRSETTNNRRILIETVEEVRNPVLAMWDVEPFAMNDGVLSGRACDDLYGVAAIIWALRQMASSKQPRKRTVAGFFTRAEEAGFCGALAAVTDPEIRKTLPEDALFVSVEISRENTAAPLGGGAVIRLGDKAGLFNPRGVTDLMELILPRSEQFNSTPRRVLMDGGTCEATAFSAQGLRAAGLCAPVRNYHNMVEGTTQLAPEQVSLNDLQDLGEMILLAGMGGEHTEKKEVSILEKLPNFAQLGRERLNFIPIQEKILQFS
jgi:putative aminopeptidase FrvX